MRNYIYFFMILLGMSFSSCNNDELGPTIFPEVSDELDKNSPSYALDNFIKIYYLDRYNMKFDYRMQDIESNMNYNLVPATYENSIDMAVLIKYLWYDVYEKIIAESKSEQADKFFMKRYGPKMIMLVGSPAINEATETEELGLAENGVKISLMAVNRLDVNDTYSMNNYYFRTMHHEFSHILHQNIAYPEDFKKISTGLYSAAEWQDKENQEVRSRGFVTPYASKDYNEDFVETIANYIVSTDEEWEQILEEAGYDYELIEVSNTEEDENGLTEYVKAKRETETYILEKDPIYMTGTKVIASCKILRYAVVRNGLNEDDDLFGELARDENGNVVYRHDVDMVDGVEIINKKLEYVRNYLDESFGIDLDVLRHEVLSRMYVTDSDGNFVKDNGKYINRLTYPISSDKNILLIDSLRNQLEVLIKE